MSLSKLLHFLCAQHISDIKTPDKTYYKTHHATHKHEQKKEMGNIHIHFPTNMQRPKHIQKLVV